MSKIDDLIAKQRPNGVEFMKLGDVCDLFIGEFVKKTKQDKDYIYPVYNGGSRPTGQFNEYNCNENSVVISARGSIGFVNWVASKFWAGNSCYVLKNITEQLNHKFL